MKDAKQNQSVARMLLLMILALPPNCLAAPSPAARHRFDLYAAALEQRLAQQHASARDFCAIASADKMTRLHRGEMVIEHLTPRDAAASGAMLHHWRGTAFLPGGSAAQVTRLMRDIAAYPQVYAPQLLSAQQLVQSGEHYQALLRVRQQHVLTVTMDTAYDITFGSLDSHHGFGLSPASACRAAHTLRRSRRPENPASTSFRPARSTDISGG
jgi:hypothetical protein